MQNNDMQEIVTSIRQLAKRIRELETVERVIVGGGGGGAPDNALYLTLALNGNLTAERRFIDGDGLQATDGGANANYTLNIDVSDFAGDGLEDDGAENLQIALSADLAANLLGFAAGNLDLDSQLANLAFLSPNGALGKPSFRALVEADIPAAFLTVAEGDARYWRYDRIIRTDGTGTWDTYDSDGAGLAAAIAAAGAGETIWLPAGTYANNHTIPNGVTIRGMTFSDVILSGQITHGDGAVLEDLSIIRTANDTSTIYGLLTTNSGTCYLDNVKISITQNGVGAGVGIKAFDRGGSLEITDCDIYGSSHDIT